MYTVGPGATHGDRGAESAGSKAQDGPVSPLSEAVVIVLLGAICGVTLE
jgi:hypothetical protein